MLLDTDRLLLREFQEGDWTAVHEYASNTEVFRHMKGGPNTEEQSKAYVQQCVVHQFEQPRQDYEFAIVLKAEKHLIVACRISFSDRENRQGFVGYILDPSYWNQGYATEACRKVIAFGFTELRLHRIFATCAPANVSSAQVLQKAGMRLGGHLREDTLSQGKWRDSLLYALLESEWQASQSSSNLAISFQARNQIPDLRGCVAHNRSAMPGQAHVELQS